MKSEQDIFLQAIEYSDEQSRAQFLDDACGDDAQLRINVEELLRASGKAAEFLEQPPNVPGLALTLYPEAGTDDGQDLSLDFLTPSDRPGCLGTLGCYEVVGIVGRGAFGIVLRAYDTKLNRVVAIKVMAPELATNPMAVKRFLREAQAAAAVRHDHVVTIHAIEETHAPPFIVMDFVQGESLKEKIERDGALELAEILRIGRQMAVGLAAAHEQGLVHRDIKPANILLENGIKRVKITDFGLARAVDDVGMTQTGIIAGTPQYMSPEQGLGKPIDARSDLFSLGAVLYALCTGHAAFKADSAVAVLRQVCDEEPKPIRKINPDIPEWLDGLVMQLLAKDAGDRFQSAGEVAKLFNSCLAHLQSEGATPLPSGLRNARPIKQPWHPLLSFLIWAQLLGTFIAIVMELEKTRSSGAAIPLLAFGLGIPIAVIAAKSRLGRAIVGYGLFWPGTMLLGMFLAPIFEGFIGNTRGRLHDPHYREYILNSFLLAILSVGVPWGIYALWSIVPGWKPKRSSFLWPTDRLYWGLNIAQCVVISGGFAFLLVDRDSIGTSIPLAFLIGVTLSFYATWLGKGGSAILFAIAGPILALFCISVGNTINGGAEYLSGVKATFRLLLPFVATAVLLGLFGIYRELMQRSGEKARVKQFGLRSGMICVGILGLVLALAIPFLSFGGEAYVAGCIFLGTLACLAVFGILYFAKKPTPENSQITSVLKTSEDSHQQLCSEV